MRCALLVGLVAVGCASVRVTPVQPGPPRPEDHPIDVYMSEKEIKRPYVVTCIVHTQTGSTLFHDRSAAAAVEDAKVEARKCGSDGIVIQSADTEALTMTGWGEGNAVVKGIRYTDGR